MSTVLPPETRALLTLHLIPGLGPRLTAALLQRFSSAEGVLRASAAQLREVPYLGGKLAADLEQAVRSADIERELERMQQYGVKRPLEIRIAPPRKLHDRHIIVDGTDVWTLGQSFNALAQHSPTGITKTVDPQTAADKREAYEDIWKTAVPMPDA